MSLSTVVRYECRNALRSKWLYAYTALLTLANLGFSYLAADVKRTDLALISVLTLLVPLVAMLFTTTYWYSSERFTELLLTQPVSRACLFWSRIFALTVCQNICLALALILPTLAFGHLSLDFVWLFGGMASVCSVFCALAALISTSVSDRMWGIGLGLATWFYFVAIHDALSLVLLYWFRDYPLDLPSAIACAFNPISIVRVSLMMHFDAPLLLGHAGALVRRLLDGSSGIVYAVSLLFAWILVSLFYAYRKFTRRDF